MVTFLCQIQNTFVFTVFWEKVDFLLAQVFLGFRIFFFFVTQFVAKFVTKLVPKLVTKSVAKFAQFVSKFGQSAQIPQIWAICVQIDRI